MIEEAERLLRAGDYDGASLKIEELPAAERMRAPVLELRLRIAICAGAWDLSDTMANVLKDSPDEAHRQTVADYHYARAVAHCDAGEIDQAKQHVAKAAKLWPVTRAQMIDDERLSRIF